VTIAAQFAQARVGALTALRAQSVLQSLRRIGSDEGCRGQDPTAVPDWLSSPLGFGMAGGSDYVTGTAVGAPVAVLIAAAVGAAVGVVGHAVAHLVIYPLRSLVVRALTPAASSKAARVALPSWGRRAQDVLPPAAAGAATGMCLMAGVVSQTAAAAATLRLAEGAVAGTPTWYSAAAAVGALATVALPTTALFVAWPRTGDIAAPVTDRRGKPPFRASQASPTPSSAVARGAVADAAQPRMRIMFAAFARRLDAMPLRLFRPKGLKLDWARPTDRGEWQTLSPPTRRLLSPLLVRSDLAPAGSSTRPLSPLLGSTSYTAIDGTPQLRAADPEAFGRGSDDRMPALLSVANRKATATASGEHMPALALPTALPLAAFHSATATWQAPPRRHRLTGVVGVPNGAAGRAALRVAAPPPPVELARHAWREAL
jgi:hypothetical protein